MYRHQLDRLCAQLLQMLKDRIGGQTLVGAAQVFRHQRMLLGQAPDMSLIDQVVAALPMPALRQALEQTGIRDNRPWHKGCAVGTVERQVSA